MNNGCCGEEISALVPAFSHANDARCLQTCAPGSVHSHPMQLRAINLPGNSTVEQNREVSARCINSTMRVDINLQISIDLLDG